MQTGPTTTTPPEQLTSTEIPIDPFVSMVADFITGIVQHIAATGTGALVLGLVLLLLLFRARRHRGYY